MEGYNWTMLYIVAIFFDILAFVFILPATVPYVGWVLGFLAVVLNIFAGLTFLTWFLIWKSKGLGEFRYFKNVFQCWFVEGVPIVGSFMPTWTFMVYRAENMYSGGPLNTVTSQINNFSQNNKVDKTVKPPQRQAPPPPQQSTPRQIPERG
jgi:hypothetical protein